MWDSPEKFCKGPSSHPFFKLLNVPLVDVTEPTPVVIMPKEIKAVINLENPAT